MERVFADYLSKAKPEIFEIASKNIKVETDNVESIRWRLLYALREGIDLNHPKALDLYLKILSGRYLPSASGILRTQVHMAPDNGSVRIRASIEKLKSDLEHLDDDGDLRPAANLIEPLVQSLKASKDVKPGFLERLRNRFR